MPNAEKICPRCAETVKSAALVCRYCGYEFGTPVTANAALTALPQRRESGCLGVG